MMGTFGAPRMGTKGLVALDQQQQLQVQQRKFLRFFIFNRFIVPAAPCPGRL